MIDGIKVLEEIHVVGNIGYILFAIFMCCFCLGSAYTFWYGSKKKKETIDKWVTEDMQNITRKEIVRDKVFAVIFLILSVVALFGIGSEHFTTDYMKYRVFIEDSCSYNTFTSKYEVLGTFDDGSVMIREKE